MSKKKTQTKAERAHAAEKPSQFENEAAHEQRTMSKGEKTELFRPRYRELTAQELQHVDRIKAKASELAYDIALIDGTPVPTDKTRAAADAMIEGMNGNRGANVTISLRHLEDCVYRAIKAITT
jgi:hypothetical protein